MQVIGADLGAETMVNGDQRAGADLRHSLSNC